MPEKYMPEYKSLMMSSAHSGFKAMDEVDSQNTPREKNMMEKIKQHHHSESTNFVILGGKHLFNLSYDLLRGKAGKVILMMPYAVYATFPELRFPLKKHDEL